MLKKNIIIVILEIGIISFTGCCSHHPNPPMLPMTWNGRECNTGSLEDNPEQSKLHVMVMYHKKSCTHTALRVYCRSRGPLFWDPAGGFARQYHFAGPPRRTMRFATKINVDSVRENDVIAEKVPSLKQYLNWRKRIHTHAVEIFEFHITDDEAEDIWTILRYGTKRSHPKGSFHTNAMGGTCGFSIAKFLHRFAENIVKVDTVFFPHNLARQLYQENPDRVIIYRDNHLYCYFPSENLFP